MTNRRRAPTAIQVLNYALERVAFNETRPDKPVEGAGAKKSKVKEVKPTTSLKVPKEKKAELINTRVLLTR